MMGMMHFKSELIEKAYRTLQNYEVEDSGENPSVSVIYFTGNAVYWPDDDATVNRRIFENNRYDYRHYRRQRKHGEAVREIFVRDVLKQWYLFGINEETDTVEKLAELLKELTAGTDVITVGNSAGGYAACLYGALLEAKQVFTFSGQFSLAETAAAGDEISEDVKTDPGCTQYFDLTGLIRDSSVPVFYFYPAGAPQDQNQYPLVQGIPNVHQFRMKGTVHGSPVLDYSIPAILAADAEQLTALAERNRDRAISPVVLSAQTAGTGRTMYALLYDGVKKIYRKIRYRG